MIALLQRLWPFIKPYRSRLMLGVLFGLLFALANAALMVAVKLVVDLIFGPAGASVAKELQEAPSVLRKLVAPLQSLLPDLRSPSSKLGLLLAIATVPAIMLLRGTFAYLNTYMMNWAALRAIGDLRARLFEHLQDLSLSFYNRAKTGDLISRITNDTERLYIIFSTSFISVVKDPLTVLALLALLLSRQPRLTLVSVVVFPVILIPIVVYGRKVRQAIQAMQAHASELTTLMHEAFTANRIIKAYNLEQAVADQFKATIRKCVSQSMRILRSFELPSQLTEFLGAIGVSLVFVYVGLFSHTTMKAGDFLQFVGSVFLLYQPVKALSRLHNQLEQARAASERIFELLETRSTVLDPPKPVHLRAANANIDFEDVDFGYGDKPVLRGINLTVTAGQVVALVGSSGSGKTTLTHLLLRFYDPQRGAVRIGRTDVRQVAIKDLRRQIALVAQETILFNDTIRHNIALGRPGATGAEIETAARHAYAHDFIIAKPEGYETVVGEKGITLSGGQRQRIAIARAILKDAPILVLDEATNALDAESERAVQAALEKLMVGRTTICIAHRLSTIQKADLIVVLEGGRIAESGTHAELIQARGVYFRLYEMQFDPVMAA